MIVEIVPAKVKGKRFTAVVDDGRQIHFGQPAGSTFIDHGDKSKRMAYWARHIANPTEKRLITAMVPSPALMSAYLLWGDSTSLSENVRSLNKRWES